MFEIVKSGGWVMVPLILCSIVALAIIGERFWSLQRRRICPPHLVPQIWQWLKNKEFDTHRLAALRKDSPLGRILAAGLVNLRHERAIMKEAIEDAGRQAMPELERYLNTLGTIAAIAPLLGLLGTVTGIIRSFHAISGGQGMGNPQMLAGGISEALITTAAGLIVAIPSVMFYRYFRGRVDELVISMEQEALKMVEMLHGERESEQAAPAPVASPAATLKTGKKRA